MGLLTTTALARVFLIGIGAGAVTAATAQALAVSPNGEISRAADTAADTDSRLTEQGAADDIVVTGFRSSLQKAVALKREAIGVRDSVVAEDIGKFPEANVAEALQRIPGVYLSRDGASNEGQRISIRGLGSEFSVTTLNGAPVRTTSSNNVGGSSRDFNYDVFASELFGRVDFYKTPLAELEEGGIGGVVDLQTPRPFDNPGRVIRYSVQGSYNTASKKVDPNAFGLVSATFGDFGVLIGAAHSTSVNTKSGFEATGGYNTNALAAAGKGPFTFALDYNDPRTNLGSLTKAQIDNAYLPRFYRYYGAENTRHRDGFVASVEYKHGGLDLSVDTLFSRLKDARDEFTFGLPIRNSKTTAGTTAPNGYPGHNGLVPIDVTIDPEGNLLEGTFGNTDYLGESYYYNDKTKFGYVALNGKYEVTDKLRLTGQVSGSKSNAFYTGNRVVSNIYGITSTIDYTDNHVYPALSAPGVDFTNPANYRDFSVGYDWNREIDRERTAKLVADWDYGLPLGIEGHLKAGLSYVSTKKEKIKRNGTSLGTAKLAQIGLTGMQALMQPDVPIDNLKIGSGFPQQWATFSRDFVIGTLDPIGAALASPVDLSSSFDTEEQVRTFFVQSDFKADIGGHELRMNAGVRGSWTKTLIDNYTKAGTSAYEPNHSEGKYHNLLPSVSGAFDVLNNLVWRASWGRTITRASLSIIAANTVIPNIFNAYATSGNPNLRPQISDNYDTGLEWYIGGGGLISVGGFWKNLRDTTVSTTTMVPFSSLGLPDTALGPIFQDPTTGKVDPNLPIQLATYYNAGHIKLKGLEVAYQQSFKFLPAPFDGLGALASYTRVHTSGYDYVTNAGKVLNVYTVPKYSYSLTGYYEKGPIGIRMSYNYKGKSIYSVAETTNNGSDLERWHSGAGYLDANISYKLSERLEFRIDALNLANTLNYDFFSDASGKYGNGRKTRMDYAKYDGRTIKFGIRGKF